MVDLLCSPDQYPVPLLNHPSECEEAVPKRIECKKTRESSTLTAAPNLTASTKNIGAKSKRQSLQVI